ncbi:MAG: DUF3267 domain-containing protein [Bacteroidales bacterium]|nr:DUF3267 domain-containing protein [Bacteroidales bacterium]
MTYNELVSNPGFEQIAVIKHSDMKSFVLGEAAKRPLWAHIANIVQIMGLLVFVFGVFKVFVLFFESHETAYLRWMLYGLIFTFTFLIVIHEFIHAIAYKIVGARYLSFGMNLRKFMFYVQADKQVLDYGQFQIVALAPAITIGIVSLLGMVFFYNQPAFYFLVPVFAFHGIFCGGDFGLLCFFQNHSDKKIVTFDIKAEGKTYFYSGTLNSSKGDL